MELNILMKSCNIDKPVVSIIMLVYNAPLLTLQTLYTLKKTKNVNYEVVVLDNASRWLTKLILFIMYKLNFIDTLITTKENTYFAGGNNIASLYCNKDSKYYLLLNSDIKIINPNWLDMLIRSHKYGVSSIGVCNTDKKYARCDGYCMLIDKDLYDEYKLDENYKWWYATAKLQTQILNKSGCFVRGCVDDSTLIKHYWGGSGKAFKKVLKVLPESEMEKWFSDTQSHFQLIDLNAEYS